jgi:hypothetical protein
MSDAKLPAGKPSGRAQQLLISVCPEYGPEGRQVSNPQLLREAMLLEVELLLFGSFELPSCPMTRNGLESDFVL